MSGRKEEKSILNERCAYVLLALGKASRDSGLELTMPAWGNDCQAKFPNGVTITLLNRDILVLRPLGYRPSITRGTTGHCGVTSSCIVPRV